MKKLLTILVMFFFITGFGEKHSDVQTKVNKTGDKLTIDFAVVPHKGMMATLEGPWSLTIKETNLVDLPWKDGKYVHKDFKKELANFKKEKAPGFILATSVKQNPSQGELSYDIRAFVCTDDKKRCYPQRHRGKVKIP